MPLSPEERHRIYLEEKARLDIHEELFVAKPAKKSSRAKWLLLIFTILLIAAGLSRNETSTPGARPESLILPSLDTEWRKEGFDNIMMGNFTIHNKNAFDVKDIEIKCQHFGKSGTPIDSNRKTIYEVVKAKSKKTVRNFNMGFIHTQAATTSCTVTDAERS